MPYSIKTIILEMPLHMGRVNCYLVEGNHGYMLIDTGNSARRQVLSSALQALGCTPGSLRLVLLTHGDFDHTGNAAYLREKFSAPVGMHPEDARMVEQGDMFANRKKPNLVIKVLLPLFSGFGKSERFAADILFADDQDLEEFGLQARVLSLPGHSRGSIGVLTSEGDMLCGDLFVNIDKPALNTLLDNTTEAGESLRRLQELKIRTVYPGHGEPFAWALVDKYLPG